MSKLTRQLSQSHDVSAKVTQILQTRTKLASSVQRADEAGMWVSSPS